MKIINYSILLFFGFISCKSNTQNISKDIDYSFLEKEWVKVTEVKGEKVIFKPCDAENSKIIPNTKLKKITVKYGVENQVFDYKKVVFDNENKNFKITGVSYLGTTVGDIIYIYNNEIESTWIVPNEVSITSTTSLNKYKKVKEDCGSTLSNFTIEYYKDEYKKMGFNLLLFNKKHDIDLDKNLDAFLVFKNESNETNILVILKGIDENNFKIWEQSKKIISNVNDGCPAEGFDRIVLKDNYFTIEQSNCDGWNFINTGITFRYQNELKKIILHKHSIEYTDRRNPDREIPIKIFDKKKFGELLFKNFDNRKLLYN